MLIKEPRKKSAPSFLRETKGNGLTLQSSYANISRLTKQAAIAQSVERRIGSAEVTGPIPVSSFRDKGREIIQKRRSHVHMDFCVFVLSQAKQRESDVLAKQG